jgi:hypothetical protein
LSSLDISNAAERAIGRKCNTVERRHKNGLVGRYPFYEICDERGCADGSQIIADFVFCTCPEDLELEPEIWRRVSFSKSRAQERKTRRAIRPRIAQ